MGSVELQALERALGELLSVLHDQDNGPTQAAEAWSRCQAAGRTLTELMNRASELEPKERDELRGSLERLLRLNAVARQAVRDEQDSLAQLLSHTRKAGQKLRAYATGPASVGDSCDLAG